MRFFLFFLVYNIVFFTFIFVVPPLELIFPHSLLLICKNECCSTDPCRVVCVSTVKMKCKPSARIILVIRHTCIGGCILRFMNCNSCSLMSDIYFQQELRSVTHTKKGCGHQFMDEDCATHNRQAFTQD